MATKKELEARVAELEREVGSAAPDKMMAVQNEMVTAAEYGDAERMKTREGNLEKKAQQHAAMSPAAPEAVEEVEEALEVEEAPAEDEAPEDPVDD